MANKELTFADKLSRKKLIDATVGDFLSSYKPLTEQTDEEGNVFVQPSHVAYLMTCPREALLTTGQLVTVSKDGEILQGNHRREALRRLVEGGDKQLLSTKFKMWEIQDELTTVEKGQIVMGSNQINAKTNFRAHASKGGYVASDMLFNPCTEALKIAGKRGVNYTKNKFTAGRLVQLAQLLGTIFHNHPEYVELLKKKLPVPITARQLYEARNGVVGGRFFWRADKVNCDLRPYVGVLADLLTDGCQTIMEFRDTGDWASCMGKVGKNSSFEYVVLGMSLRGKLFYNAKTTREAMSKNAKPYDYKHMRTIINRDRQFFRDTIEGLQNRTRSSEHELLKMFSRSGVVQESEKAVMTKRETKVAKAIKEPQVIKVSKAK